MRSLIFDTDILSTFGKLKKLYLYSCVNEIVRFETEAKAKTNTNAAGGTFQTL